MKNFSFKIFIPHIIAVAVFLTVTLMYCSPALQGKVLQQSDVTHWKAMAQQVLTYKDAHGHLPLWSNSMFGGMPAYQIAMEPPNFASVERLHSFFTLFLPHPFDFFFLMCISFYFLSQVFKVDYRIGIAAAIAYAYASFSPILVVAGHATQILTMGYMPALLGAFFLVFQKKYWIGGALCVVFASLLISMNHPQVTYYFGIVTACLVVTYIIIWVKQKEYKHMIISLCILAGAGLLGVANNLVPLATTYDYSKATMRNGVLNLDTTANKATATTGLPIDYAFQWSFQPSEVFTILIPNIYGGMSGGAEFGADSHVAKMAIQKGISDDQAAQLASEMPAYWGNQPFTSGPVYLGAIICFLFVFGMIYLKTPDRWWILAACTLTIMMSWGKNFAAFNDFLFYHLPMYDKFRVPTMALLITQFLFPILAMLALQQFIFNEKDKTYALKKLKTTGYVMIGIFAIAAFLYTSFDYKSDSDANLVNQLSQMMQGNKQDANSFYNALKEDRQSLFGSDLLRSIFFAGAAFLCLWLILKNKIKPVYALFAIVLLSSIDVIAESRRYFNNDKFLDQETSDGTFSPSAADAQILKDTGYYRMADFTKDWSEDAMPSYFHNNIGGYSPAKLSIMQDLLTYQLNKQPQNIQVLNMLNTKYVVVPDQKNQPLVEQNPGALGACWFVKNVEFKNGPADAMRALNNFNPKDTAIVESDYKNAVPFSPVADSTASIQLVKNDNDEIFYKSDSKTNQFAVFSEIFYDRGWKAYIDDKETPIAKTDYVLRGLAVPAGTHQIRFEFKPSSYYDSLKIAVAASLISWLLIIGAVFQSMRKKKNVIV
jgi:hypothetical protein